MSEIENTKPSFTYKVFDVAINSEDFYNFTFRLDYLNEKIINTQDIELLANSSYSVIQSKLREVFYILLPNLELLYKSDYIKSTFDYLKKAYFRDIFNLSSNGNVIPVKYSDYHSLLSSFYGHYQLSLQQTNFIDNLILEIFNFIIISSENSKSTITHIYNYEVIHTLLKLILVELLLPLEKHMINHLKTKLKNDYVNNDELSKTLSSDLVLICNREYPEEN